MDIKKHDKLVAAKVTCLLQYKMTPFVIATLSSGHIAVIDMDRTHVLSITKVHKGNITSACFLENFEYFATASGAFGKRQDNCINVYRVIEVLGDLFVRKVHNINNAHGKNHGVMCLRSSNMIGDRSLFSCGYQDDGRVRVWDFMQRCILAEVEAQHRDFRDTIYRLHTLTFEGVPSVIDQEEDKGKSS